MNTPLTPAIPSIPTYKAQLAKLVSVLINRVYTDGIDRITSISVSPELLISGSFQDEDRLFDFWLDLPSQKLWYQRSKQNLDSFYPKLDKSGIRSTRPRNCTVGDNCGGTCIPRGNVCRVGQIGKTLARPGEIQAVEAVAKQVARTSQATQPKDDLEDKTLRELRAIAAPLGVVKYSRMSTEELRRAVRKTRSDPDSQNLIRRSLQTKAEAKRAIKQSSPQLLASTWRQLERISKLSNTNPEVAGLLAATFLASTTLAVTQRIKDKYRSGLNESANMAIQRAQGIPVTQTDKPNLLFAVGGFTGIGSTGQRMKDILESPGDGTAGDRWFSNAHEIIPFNHREFDISPPSVSKKNEDGSYNPAYLGYVAKSGFGKFIQNFNRGRNEASVDLAANLYAHGSKYKNANVSVLGHGVGGNVVREATEILQRMRSPDGKAPSGADIIKRMNIVNLGTPYFGFTDSKVWDAVPNRTITSGGDPFSVLPKKAAQWISAVRGGEIDDYLKVSEVRDRLREAFGYYSSSIKGSSKSNKENQQRFKAIGETLEAAGFNTGAKLWRSLNGAANLYQQNPVQASLIAAAAVYQGSSLAYKTATNRYQSNIRESAIEAERIAGSEINVANIRKPNHLFVVGGSGAPSQAMIDSIRAGAKEDPNLGWVASKNHIDGFDPQSATQESGSLSGGAGGVLRNIYGGTLGRVLNAGKDNDAIRLAATLHAYGTTEHSPGGSAGPRKIPINILAGSDGGNTAREAIDILQKMKGGQTVIDRLQLVTLGTPSFLGLASEDMRETQIIGDRDEIANLPFFQRGGGKTRRASGVRNHDPVSYIAARDASRQVADAFKSNQVKKPQASNSSPPKKQSGVDPRPDNPANAPGWENLPKAEQKRLRQIYLRRIREERKRRNPDNPSPETPETTP